MIFLYHAYNTGIFYIVIFCAKTMSTNCEPLRECCWKCSMMLINSTRSDDIYEEKSRVIVHENNSPMARGHYHPNTDNVKKCRQSHCDCHSELDGPLIYSEMEAQLEG